MDGRKRESKEVKREREREPDRQGAKEERWGQRGGNRGGPISSVDATKVQTWGLCRSNYAISSKHNSANYAPPWFYYSLCLTFIVNRMQLWSCALCVCLCACVVRVNSLYMINMLYQYGLPCLKLPQTSQPPPISKIPATTNTPTCVKRAAKAKI